MEFAIKKICPMVSIVPATTRAKARLEFLTLRDVLTDLLGEDLGAQA